MNRNRWTAIFLSFFMVIQALASMVYAEGLPAKTLSGELRIQGLPYAGGTLTADLSKLEPAGITGEDVTFLWIISSLPEEKILSETGSCTLTEKEIGQSLELTITGRSDRGLSGALTVKTEPVAATKEEAEAGASDGTLKKKNPGTAGENDGEGTPYQGTGENGEEGNPYQEAGEYGEEGTPYQEAGEDGENWSQFQETEQYFDENGLPVEMPGADAQADSEGQTDDGEGTDGEDYGDQYELPGMEVANEEYYAYDPVTGQETTGNTASSGENTLEEIYQAEAEVKSETGELDFGIVKEESLSDPEIQYFSITNTGTGTLNFESISPEHFMVGDINEPLQPGETVDLFIQPRESVEPGEYRDEITYRSEEGAETTVVAAVTVEPAGSAQNSEINENEGENTESPAEETTESGESDAESAIETGSNPEQGDGSETGDGSNSEQGDSPETGDGTGAEQGDNPETGDGTNPEQGDNPETEDGTGSEEDPEQGDGPETGEDPEPEENPELVVSLAVEPEVVDFGSEPAGYSDQPGERTFEVINRGTAPVILSQPASQIFVFSQPEALKLAPGETLEFQVRPVAGLDPGSYNESVVLEYQAILPEEYDGVEDPAIILPDTDYRISLSFVVTEAAAEYALEIDPGEYDFGSVTEGYQEAPGEAVFTLTNKGTMPCRLTSPESRSYEISELSAGRLMPEETASFTVRPKTGLAAGDYPESLSFYIMDTDWNSMLLVTLKVNFSVKKGEEKTSFSLDRTSIDFGSADEGYTSAPKAQAVTITNTGNTVIVLKQPKAANYSVSALTNAQISPGASAKFTIAPKKGLVMGSYPETITITGDGNASAVLEVNFNVGVRKVKLTGIESPANIANLPNGTEKTLQALRLPDAVVLLTSKGNLNAPVSWDVASSVYDPSLKTAQTFTVNGRVTLPAGVLNPNNIPLVTAVRVSVNGRSPIVWPSSGNQVSGISNGAVYTTEDKISFTASGSGYPNLSPVQGDVRYIPYSWNVMETRLWDGEDFNASFRMGRVGSYTLTVTFLQQQFNNEGWVNTGDKDIRTITFSVQNSQIATMTPVPGQVRAARTGDDTSVLPMVLLLAGAAAVICAAIVILKRRRK